MSGGGPGGGAQGARVPSDRRQMIPGGSRDTRVHKDDAEVGRSSEQTINHEHAQFLMENLRKIYEDENCLLSDVVLRATDGEVPAHKIILAAHSEYFKGMFRSEKKDSIDMTMSKATLKNIVSSLYTGRAEVNINNVQDLLEASNYLQIKDLNSRCVDFMARNLDHTNCVAVLKLADALSIDRLSQEAIDYIGDHFQQLFQTSEEFKQLPVELFAKCIKSDKVIVYSKYGTVLPAIQREEALVKMIVKYVKCTDYQTRIKDTWPLFRALKLPFVAHHLDFTEIGLPDLANFEDDPTLHSLIRSSKIPKEDDLRRRYSVDPFSKHNSRLRASSVKYNLWTERFGSGPKSAYREVRPFSCEGGPDKFLRSMTCWFRRWEDKLVLGGIKVGWSNGSTDVMGATNEGLGEEGDMEEKVAVLGDNENFQRLDLRSGWYIEQLKFTTNTGRVFGPWGGDGGEERRPHRHIRRNVNPRHVYLDGVRGYVVQTQGQAAVNRVSFKWSFVLEKKVSRYSYHNSVVLRPETEKLSVLDLERDINLTDSEESVYSSRRGGYFSDPRYHPASMAAAVAGIWSDEDDIFGPPHPSGPQHGWHVNVHQVEQGPMEQHIVDMDEESEGTTEEEEEVQFQEVEGEWGLL